MKTKIKKCIFTGSMIPLSSLPNPDPSFHPSFSSSFLPLLSLSNGLLVDGAEQVASTFSFTCEKSIPSTLRRCLALSL